MSEKYRIVTATFRSVSRTGNAFFVEKSATRGSGEVSIPFSLIHGGDVKKVESASPRAEITFRLFEWKAEELGLA